MSELTWIIDSASGQLTVEGLEEVPSVIGGLLPPGVPVNCARPRTSELLAPANSNLPGVRIARIYHGSVVDGPGRRSVVQFQGCPIRCPGCYVPETHDSEGGILMTVADVVALLLDSSGEPRDGVTISGGEPSSQPSALLALLRELRARKIHSTVYSGFTFEALARRPEPDLREALALADLLVDGPYVSALSDGAGEWRGSRNQRFLPNPAAGLPIRALPEPSRTQTSAHA